MIPQIAGGISQTFSDFVVLMLYLSAVEYLNVIFA